MEPMELKRISFFFRSRIPQIVIPFSGRLIELLWAPLILIFLTFRGRNSHSVY